MSGTLEGIKILDLTRVLAGPYCTMILSDLGAEVIKIERPETGDDSRAFGPWQNGESAYFMSVNRGKKSLSLNLKTEQGKEIFKKLVKTADIVVENFRPGIMEKLSLGYEDLKAINPRLIYCACSGFGQTGPYSSKAAYDLVIQGMGGMMSITGPDQNTPTKTGSSIADILAGMFSAIGILSALNRRHQTGKGQMVDVGMLDCMVAILENAIARYSTTGKDPVPIGNRHPSIAPFTTVKASDGYINIACGNNALFANLCKLLEMPDLANDSRFATNDLRCENIAQLIEIINSVTVKNTKEYWLSRFSDGSVPSGPINKISEVLQDPHVIARNMILELNHPVAGKTQVAGMPIKFSDDNPVPEVPAPVIGQHTKDILSDMGYTQEQIDRFSKDKII